MSQIHSIQDVVRGFSLTPERKEFLDNFVAEHKFYQEENKGLKTKKSELEGQVSALTQSHQTEVKDLKKAHTDKLNELTNAHATEVGELTEASEEKDKEIETQGWRKSFYRGYALFVTILAAIALAGTTYEVLSRGSLEAQVIALDTKNKDLIAQGEESGHGYLITRNKELELEHGALTEQNSVLQATVNDLSKQVADLKSVKPDDQIVQLKNQATGLQTQLDNAKTTTENVRRDLQAKLDTANADLKSAQDENEKLKEKLQSASSTPAAGATPSLKPEADQPVTQSSDSGGPSMVDSSPGATADQASGPAVQDQNAGEDAQAQVSYVPPADGNYHIHEGAGVHYNHIHPLKDLPKPKLPWDVYIVHTEKGGHPLPTDQILVSKDGSWWAPADQVFLRPGMSFDNRQYVTGDDGILRWNPHRAQDE